MSPKIRFGPLVSIWPALVMLPVNDRENESHTKRTMLIVDDQQSVCVALEFLLGDHGYNVVTATSGGAAIAFMDQHTVDGAIIDVHMPGMNGFDTYAGLQAKAQALGRTLRTWFMTGACTTLIETRAAEIGALAVLRKPFNFPALLATFEAGFAAQSAPTTPPSASEAGEENA